MNAPTITAVLPSPPTSAPRGPDAGAKESSQNPTFSDVLTGQQTQVRSEGQPVPATQHAASPNAERPNSNDKKHGEPASDEELAVLAGEQGLSLPQIAINIATHAALAAAPGSQATLKETRPDGKMAFPAAQARAHAHAATAKDSSINAETAALQSGTGKDLPALHADSQPGALLNGQKPTAAHTEPKPALAHQTQTEAAKPGKRLARADAPAMSTPASSEPELNIASAGKAAPQETLHLDKANDVASQLQAAVNGVASAHAAATIAQTSAPVTAVAQNTAPIVHNLAVDTTLQNPQWANDFSRQVATLTQSGHGRSQTVELRLNPPELGPIRISININDNVAQAIFVSPHAAVRQAVENALPALQQQLAQSGISLGQTSVNDQEQERPVFDQAPRKGKSSGSSVAAIDSGGSRAVTAANAHSTAPDALVDTFV